MLVADVLHYMGRDDLNLSMSAVLEIPDILNEMAQ